MFRVRIGLFGIATAICACGVAPSLTASTLTELPELESSETGAFSLARLLREDVLGGTCIAEEDIDQAFFATGKGLRLPRTCLPEPCEQALTPFHLAELIGRPAQASEWDRYFSRYADACRKEVVSFGDDTVVDAPETPAEFWAPIIGARVVQGQLVRITSVSNRLGPRLGGNPRSTPVPPFQPTRFTGPVPTVFTFLPDDDPEGPGGRPGNDQPEIAAVPLPMGVWMLFSGLLGLMTLRKFRA